MDKEYYYVYCQGLLGVKTNFHNFKWVYGSVAPEATSVEYEKCILKFNVYEKKEKELGENFSYDKQFQAYLWDSKSRTLFYRRNFFSLLKIGYNITFNKDSIDVYVGRMYLQLVKKRMMNLHGMYYLLADLANMLLLNKGYLTLYASAVCSSVEHKGVVFFAPPNTGKTLTAMKLCEFSNFKLVGEDIVITDGNQLFACPWTSSYRQKTKLSDSASAFGRVNQQLDMHKVSTSCVLTQLVVLALGEKELLEDKNEVLKRIVILNGYLFNYYSSPIVKVLNYFTDEYYNDWNNCAEKMLRKMVDNCNCYVIQSKNSLDFSEVVKINTMDGKI